MRQTSSSTVAALLVLILPSTDAFLQPRSCHHNIISSSSTFLLNAVSQRQTFIIDGGELESFLLHNNNIEGETLSTGGGRGRNVVGSLTLVTGSTQDGSRVIGVQVQSSSTKTNDGDDVDNNYETVSLGDAVDVYKHTIATIPQSVSDNDALSTAAAAVVGVHCALPRVGGVGGSDNSNDVFYSGKTVIIGGNDFACFLADAMASLGIEVSIVSNNGGIKVKNGQVNVMKPYDFNDDYEEIGFSTAIGQFDSMVDTISNERKGMIISPDNPYGGSTLLQLLDLKHQCNKYISTLTQSQQIVKNEGVLFGPGKANAHVKAMESVSLAKCISLVPSLGFGKSTLQRLLDSNVLFTGGKNNNNKSIVARGWTMKDFWEETSWPRDSSGTGIRYGFPVQEEEDLDELFRKEQERMQQRARVGSPEERGGMDNEETTKQLLIDEKNPYVTQIMGVDGLAQKVISQQKDCVIFVAMRSCRTCKGINPIFSKLARERGGDNLMFAKADATGASGKALGRQLGVESVPSFVLFRNGVRYGAVSTSRLPSDRLDRAIQGLVEGDDFDPSLEEDE